MSDYADRARRFVADVWNGGREESAYDLIAADCPGLGAHGPEGTLAWHRDRRASFPDLHYELLDVLADGPKVALRWHATGTQEGDFGPVPPTGRAVTYSGASILTFDGDGRIADVWSVNELFQLLQQLGVGMLPPEQ